jgi:hypothetical protein
MKPVGQNLLSRLWGITAILCMVVMLNASFAATQSSLLILEHQTSGDMKLADGGWLSACDGSQDGCAGHIDAPAFPDDTDAMGLNHHHHFNESPSGTLPDMDVAISSPAVMSAVLRPNPAQRLAGKFPASIDQPPRVLSRI